MKRHSPSFGNKHLLVPASKMRGFAAFHLFMRVNEESLGGLAVDWKKKSNLKSIQALLKNKI